MKKEIALNELAPHKEYKIFLVEVDDDDRERVLVARAREVIVKSNPNYSDIVIDDAFTVHTYKTSENFTITANLLPMEDGNWFRLENFAEDEEESHA